MHKILFLLFVWSWTASIVGAVEIDECKTDVYFGNGILTSREAAIFNTDEILEPAIIEKFGIDYYNKNIDEVSYAYNTTNSFDQDITESAYQIFNITEFIEWRDALMGRYKESQHNSDIEKQVDAYEDSIKSGHKVLVVAHSQGNLFTYEARGRLIDESKDAWMDKYFQVISIASPALFSISSDTPLISWDNDLIAWLGVYNGSVVDNDIRKIVWDGVNADSSSTGNAQVPSSNYVESSQVNSVYRNEWKATESVLGKFDSVVHAFTFYMGEDLADGKILNPFNGSKLHTDKAKIIIMNAVDEKITYLEALPSQWTPKNKGVFF